MGTFDEAVYRLVRRVPRGRVTTYGDVARALGRRGRAARAVGQALLRNSAGSPVPCHRVVRADGTLGGYGGGFSGGPRRKQALLEGEGVRIRDGVIVGFGAARWRG